MTFLRWQDFIADEPDAVTHFTQRHSRGKQAGFAPTLLDARLVTSGPEAGLRGDFFNVLEVYVTGPLRGGADHDFETFMTSRARFLSSAYADISSGNAMMFDYILEGFEEDQAKLLNATKNYGRLCL